MTPPIKPTGSISADPNPIFAPAGTTLGVTRLSWSTTAKRVAVCAGSPSGQIFAASHQGSHSAETGKWVSDGMTFYLQDVSEGQPLNAAHTLATVTVKLKPR